MVQGVIPAAGAVAVVPVGDVAAADVCRDLLGTLDLHGVTVTADALHTVKATAELIRQRGGQFVFGVKENRQALFDALDALPWNAPR